MSLVAFLVAFETKTATVFMIVILSYLHSRKQLRSDRDCHDTNSARTSRQIDWPPSSPNLPGKAPQRGDSPRHPWHGHGLLLRDGFQNEY